MALVGATVAQGVLTQLIWLRHPPHQDAWGVTMKLRNV